MDYWLRQDDDRTPWLLVSHDFVVGNAMHDTLRLDFDDAGIRGGWSPANLNWDGEVRAEAADIDTTGPDGINVPAGTPNVQRTGPAGRQLVRRPSAAMGIDQPIQE
ncbi:hypothetical protein [Asanoa siamensis]|uniref:Uncharacterized protein n=1 Tax=Asanoa siamensis TaxID=926357 RepID=A0ABQ4CVD5_9ACTN|nr:hypothetical protein [Asanoa siamensis]GIF75244.1 hypothetical protein Asi02nite_47620 [Asanoa siamensis]